MRRGGLLVIHFLPDVAGSAADRSNFFLLNGVIRDEPRASPPPLHAEQPGGMTTDFSKKKYFQTKRRTSVA